MGILSIQEWTDEVVIGYNGRKCGQKGHKSEENEECDVDELQFQCTPSYPSVRTLYSAVAARIYGLMVYLLPLDRHIKCKCGTPTETGHAVRQARQSITIRFVPHRRDAIHDNP